MSYLYTDTFVPGQVITLQVETTPDGNGTIRLEMGDIPQPAAEPRQPLLVGIEGPAGSETTKIIAGFPGVQAMREFGTKRTGETLPSLPGWTASKLAVMPATCRPHVSWKYWDVARQAAWLDARPMSGAAPMPNGYWPELDTTYYHEGHGDIDPALYRQRGSAWADQLRTHPNGGGIQNGPIVTRYWLMNGGSVLDWWYDGATFYGVDVYEPEVPASMARPLTPEELWGPVLDKVYAAIPDGVDILVPEMGRRYGAGQARADALWADLDYLAQWHPRVRTVAYFNSSAFPEFAFAGTSAATVTDGGASTPEGKAWKSWMAS